MDALNGFVAIVGLVSQYRSEVKSRKQDKDMGFESWLRENQRNDVIDLLCRDSTTLTAVEELVREDNEIFKQKLSSIEGALLKFSSAIEGFDQISESLSPNKGLSQQAISILKQMEENEAEALLMSAWLGGKALMIIRGPSSGNIDIAEPRFVESDLNSLIELGLLMQDHNSKGEPLYVITREAAELVTEIEKDS